MTSNDEDTVRMPTPARRSTGEQKGTWIVRMRCVVTKDVTVERCTEAQARSAPWEHATDEREVDQIDWEVQSVTASP